MGLRGVKNALGAGVQQVTAEEAAAQTGTNPIASQMLQSAAGAGPDSVKMTGTPAQQQGALQRVAQTATAKDAQAQSQAQAQQGATVNAAAAQQSIALQTLAKTAPVIAERIKNSILAKPVAEIGKAAVDEQALTDKLGPSAPEASALLNKQLSLPKGQTLSAEETARLTQLIKPGSPSLTPGDLQAFVKDMSSTAGIDAAKQLLENKDPKAMSLGQLSDADAKTLGFQNLADLELSIRSITGKSLAKTNIQELDQAAKAYAQRNATDTNKLRAVLQDNAASGAEKQFALERLKQLGYENVLSEEARQGDLAKQIAAGDTVRIGGQNIQVQDITNSPEILGLIAPALMEGPEGERALEDLRAKDPALADWASRNREALAPAVQKFQGAIDGLKKTQEQKLEAFGGQELLADPNYARMLTHLGIDPNALDGKTVDPNTIPEPARSIVALNASAKDPSLSPAAAANLRAEAKTRADIYQKLYDSPLKARATDPNLLAELAKNPNNLDAYINLESTNDAIYDSILAQRQATNAALQARNAIPQYIEKKGKFGVVTRVTNPAWVAANTAYNAAKTVAHNNVGRAIGLHPGKVSASYRTLTDPAISAHKKFVLDQNGMAQDPAFRNADTMTQTLDNLLAVAGDNSKPIAERIEAQTKVDAYGKVIKQLDADSPEAKKTRENHAAAQDKKALIDFIQAPKSWVELSRDMAGHRQAADAMYNDTKNPNPRKLELHADSLESLLTKAWADLNATKSKYANSPSALAELRKQEAELNKTAEEVASVRKLAGWLRNNR